MFEMAYNTFDIKVSEVNRDLHMALFFSRDRVTFKLSDNPNSILVRHVLFCKQAQVECIEKYLNYCSSPELTDLLEKLLVARRKVSLGERKG